MEDRALRRQRRLEAGRRSRDREARCQQGELASYSLSRVELADVAPADANLEATGLDKPAVVTATTLDGLTYTLTVGKLSGDNHYATLAVAGEPKPEGKDAAERLKKISERLPREKALAGYTLLIPKSKLDDVLKKRADLLAQKEEKKK